MLTSNEKWTELYRQAALEVDGQKMPERIMAVRQAIRGRLRDLESSTDHHAERHEIESALRALDGLETDSRKWQ
jgi:predicted ATPase with chaperone activity